jgi:transcription antitermination factor NusG
LYISVLFYFNYNAVVEVGEAMRLTFQIHFMNHNWYVLYTRSRCEKKVASLLSKRAIENYCPLNRVVKKWADRHKLVYEPLFSSYVFVKAYPTDVYRIKQVTTDIVNFVYWLGKPAIILDTEINNIKDFLNGHSNVKIEKKDIRLNDKVKILKGPLMDREGEITAIENNKVKLFLPSLGYIMTAEVDVNNIEIINHPIYQEAKLVS